MIILSKRVGQVSSNQSLGDENNGPQDSRLINVFTVTFFNLLHPCWIKVLIPY